METLNNEISILSLIGSGCGCPNDDDNPYNDETTPVTGKETGKNQK